MSYGTYAFNRSFYNSGVRGQRALDNYVKYDEKWHKIAAQYARGMITEEAVVQQMITASDKWSQEGVKLGAFHNILKGCNLYRMLPDEYQSHEELVIVHHIKNAISPKMWSRIATIFVLIFALGFLASVLSYFMLPDYAKTTVDQMIAVMNKIKYTTAYHPSFIDMVSYHGFVQQYSVASVVTPEIMKVFWLSLFMSAALIYVTWNIDFPGAEEYKHVRGTDQDWTSVPVYREQWGRAMETNQYDVNPMYDTYATGLNF